MLYSAGQRLGSGQRGAARPVYPGSAAAGTNVAGHSRGGRPGERRQPKSPLKELPCPRVGAESSSSTSTEPWSTIAAGCRRSQEAIARLGQTGTDLPVHRTFPERDLDRAARGRVGRDHRRRGWLRRDGGQVIIHRRYLPVDGAGISWTSPATQEWNSCWSRTPGVYGSPGSPRRVSEQMLWAVTDPDLRAELLRSVAGYLDRVEFEMDLCATTSTRWCSSAGEPLRRRACRGVRRDFDVVPASVPGSAARSR